MYKTNIKRIFSLIFAAALIFTISAGCGEDKADNPGTDGSESSKQSIVCTIFPIYDWVHQILGDKAGDFDVALLIGNKVDLHNYQPSVDDMVKITTCDMFIYVGGESDEWVDGILEQSANPDVIVVSLMEILGDEAKLEEIIEGMEDDGEHEHEHEHEHEGEEEEEEEYDEHVWLSLRNAEVFCSAITDALAELSAANEGEYAANLASYVSKLSALDENYQQVTDAASTKVLLFGDRFPFRYLVDDYDIEYYAAFPGCSAETNASFDTVIFLAEKADELNLSCVMVTESSDKEIAETVINNTSDKNKSIYVLDAMQSISAADIQGGATYLSIMESNLNVLRQALT